MSSQVISYRFSPDEVSVLREKALPGESDNQTAQRLMREFLGLSTGSSTEAVKASTPSLNERIESVEEKLSTLSTSCNDLFTRLQDGIQGLQEWRQAVETQAIALPPTNPVESEPDPASVVDVAVDGVDVMLTGKELASRLEVDPGTLTKNRTKPAFTDWTRDKDPEGKAWQYLPEVKRYIPMLSTVVSTESTGEDNLAAWKAQVDAVVGAL